MWTAPIVFFARDPNVPLLTAGIWRGSEVMLGGLVGAVLHWAAEIAMGKWERRPNGKGGPMPTTGP